MEEAQDLAIVLRAGALPAPIDIISKQVVGPSLGADSIRMGTRAALWALLVVAIFMVLYYRLSGLVADLALFLNMVFLLAVMAYLQATLTLPGIAGIILTIGMAVDANILIFERVKEELRAGKTVKAAVEIGYEKAFRTILDSNVTTLITAVALYEFGTGPIRGFAVTLIVGIVASMFSAITITRAIFDFAIDRWRPQQLSIGMIDPFHGANFGFIKLRRLAFIISGGLTVLGLLAIAVQGGLKSGIDFRGGTLLEAHFDPAVPVEQVRGALGAVPVQGKTLNLSDSEIKSVENNPKQILIRVVSAGGEEGLSEGVKVHLKKTFPNSLGPDWVRQEVNVGPKIGEELMWKATKAVLWSMVGILIYIAIRFEFKFGVGALIALFHDVVMALSFLAVLGEEMSMGIVAALLTLLGYSNNDTIVVYDRIREGLRSFRRGQKYEEVVNRSINETLNRSIVVHLTVFFVLLILLFFGGEVNRAFSLTLAFGVVVGTYSSIFIASPVVVEWYLRRNATTADGKGTSREAAARRA
jgi:SecD/SecF fusion protein